MSDENQSRMLAFTVAVVYVSYTRINRVNKELIDIADYLIPLTAHKTQVDVYSRLQVSAT